MAKKFIFPIFMMLTIALSVDAQLYAPGYSNFQGVGYFVLPNGYYYGQIYAGYPQGEGYYYFIDPQMGSVFYHGQFDRGLCHGKGELVSGSGYICGTWDHGDFISQTYVNTRKIQQSYHDVWSNYWCYFATTPTYTPSYDWSWNSFSYPTYNNSCNYPTYNNYAPGYSARPSNYHASNEVKIPADTKITQIDSDTQLGRRLLGKIRQ